MIVDNARPSLNDEEIRARIAAVPFWFHQIEVAPGIVTPGIDRSAEKLPYLNLPEDLSGKRVLDIGAFDGFFSFECERRGAEVLAIDGNPATGFGVARELLGAHATFANVDVYDLTPEAFGQFDLVLCLGVLYHLRHPLLGLERIHAICRGQLILETQVCDRYFIDASGIPRDLASFAPTLLSIPLAQFYPGAELNDDPTNWWSPNLAALHGMLRVVGFEPCQSVLYGERAYVHCVCSESPAAEEWANTAVVGNPLVQPAAPRPSSENDPAIVQNSATHIQQPQNSGVIVSEPLVQALRMQSQQALQLQQALAEREAQMADLEARFHQIEEQARAARRALVAVENGRVMRILRWLKGSKGLRQGH